MLSLHFEVNAALYFRVYDAEIYGGPGSEGDLYEQEIHR